MPAYERPALSNPLLWGYVVIPVFTVGAGGGVVLFVLGGPPRTWLTTCLAAAVAGFVVLARVGSRRNRARHRAAVALGLAPVADLLEADRRPFTADGQVFHLYASRPRRLTVAVTDVAASGGADRFTTVAFADPLPGRPTFKLTPARRAVTSARGLLDRFAPTLGRRTDAAARDISDDLATAAGLDDARPFRTAEPWWCRAPARTTCGSASPCSTGPH